MFKYKLFLFIVLIGTLTSSQAYCQQDVKTPRIITVDGRVTKVDMEGGTIDAATRQGNMMFYVPGEARLLHNAQHIALMEVQPGDPVTIEYDSSSYKNNVASLVDHKPEKPWFLKIFNFVSK